jgi:DNA-binding LacI/PurR family transcriptional regulator
MVVVDVNDGSDGRSLIPELEAPGTIAMCDVLAMLGHRRIGYLTGAAGLGQAGRRRLTTLRRRCDELGMGVEHLSMRRGARPDDAAGVLREAVASNHGITALCSSLGLAPTVLNGLRAAGFRLPDDCSFATYGDSDWAAAYRPAISVVTMDLYEVATLMTRQTLALLGGDQAVSRPAPEPARFLRRESVGPSPNVGPSQSAG